MAVAVDYLPSRPWPAAGKLWCYWCCLGVIRDPDAQLREAVTMWSGHYLCWEHLQYDTWQGPA